MFLIASVLYSSVGFGGGSSYLAILALTGMAFTQIRATALLCNIAVVSGNIFLYHNQKKLDWKKILPLVIISIPLSFLGGYLKISEEIFFVLLGVTLLFAAITMWISKKKTYSKINIKPQNSIRNGSFGGIIGLVSGAVGIGGGIFLAPLLYLTNWDVPKKIAAATSVFIWANSIAGLFGQFSNPIFIIDWSLTSILLVTVFLGGQIGSRLSNKRFSPYQLKKATAILIVFVSFRILIKYLF